MRIILLSFLLLSNFSTHLISCPSSGDGDCVPSTDSYNQGANQSSNQTVTEIPNTNKSSNYNIDESDGGLPDDYVAKPSSYIKKIMGNLDRFFLYIELLICYRSLVLLVCPFHQESQS